LTHASLVVFACSKLVDFGSHFLNFDLFSLAVAAYAVQDENNDGIFEPGSKIFIRNVAWQNHGERLLHSLKSFEALCCPPLFVLFHLASLAV
jgi:hypothetical protein